MVRLVATLLIAACELLCTMTHMLVMHQSVCSVPHKSAYNTRYDCSTLETTAQLCIVCTCEVQIAAM